MDDSVEMTDVLVDRPLFKVYTFKELGIPGLSVLGWRNIHDAKSRVINHYHKDRIEIKLLITGYDFIIIEGKGYHLKGGDILITPANMSHNSGLFPTGVFEMYWIQLLIGTPSFLFLEDKWAAEIQHLLGNLQAGIICGVDYSQKYLAEMFSLLSSDISVDRYHGVSQLVNLLHCIIRAKPGLQIPFSPDIQKSIDFIHENIYEEIPLEKLADITGHSLIRFYQKFNEQVGMPPRMFINMQKVELSRELLASGKSVTETAFDLSFSSSAYFSAVFRKFTNIPPSEYARNNLIKSLIK